MAPTGSRDLDGLLHHLLSLALKYSGPRFQISQSWKSGLGAVLFVRDLKRKQSRRCHGGESQAEAGRVLRPPSYKAALQAGLCASLTEAALSSMAALTLVPATEPASTTLVTVANNMAEPAAFVTILAATIATGISTSSDASVGAGLEQ